MFQKVCVVAFGEVCARMRTARLLALERGIRDGLGHVEHVIQLERVHDFGVKRAVSIFNDDVLKTLSQSP